jgi:rubrerythrin
LEAILTAVPNFPFLNQYNGGVTVTSQGFNLLEAIQIAKEAEKKAAALYGDASQKAFHPLGRGLFEQLAAFERHHYDKLVELEKSLRGEGAFTAYEGTELAPPAAGEVGAIEEPEHMSAMAIITMAMDVERAAEKKYTAFAEKTTDPQAGSLFKRLAEEERGHYRVLDEAFWNLNEGGGWRWTA